MKEILEDRGGMGRISQPRTAEVRDVPWRSWRQAKQSGVNKQRTSGQARRQSDEFTEELLLDQLRASADASARCTEHGGRPACRGAASQSLRRAASSGSGSVRMCGAGRERERSSVHFCSPHQTLKERRRRRRRRRKTKKRRNGGEGERSPSECPSLEQLRLRRHCRLNVCFSSRCPSHGPSPERKSC